MKETKELIKKICKVRRNLNIFGQSRKIVDEQEITRIEIAGTMPNIVLQQWLKKPENRAMLYKVCPQKYYLQLNKQLNKTL